MALSLVAMEGSSSNKRQVESLRDEDFNAKRQNAPWGWRPWSALSSLSPSSHRYTSVLWATSYACLAVARTGTTSATFARSRPHLSAASGWSMSSSQSQFHAPMRSMDVSSRSAITRRKNTREDMPKCPMLQPGVWLWLCWVNYGTPRSFNRKAQVSSINLP